MTTTMQALQQGQSVQLIRNLLRLSLSTIAYLRNFFDDECFTDKRTSGGLRLKSLVGKTDEAALMIDWLEKGVFDAFDKKYLRVCTIIVYDGDVEHPDRMHEAYDFAVTYDASGTAELTLSTSGQGRRQQHVCRSRDEATEQMAVAMRQLVSLTQSLPQLPSCHTISMQLQYYEDRTPSDYEPPFFRCGDEATRRAAGMAGATQQVAVAIGGLATVYHNVTMRMRSAGAFAGGNVMASQSAAEDVADSQPVVVLPLSQIVAAPVTQLSPGDIDVLVALLQAAGNNNTTSVEHLERGGMDTSRAESALERLVQEAVLAPSSRRGRAARHFTLRADDTAVRAAIHSVLGRDELLALVPNAVDLTSRVEAAMGLSGGSVPKRTRGDGPPAPEDGVVAAANHVSVVVEPKRRKI